MSFDVLVAVLTNHMYYLRYKMYISFVW